jgi:sulfur carrier protein ThiS
LSEAFAELILNAQEYEVEPGITILYALVRLDIDVRVVQAIRDGELTSLQAHLEDKNIVKLVPLIAGG